MFRVLAFLLLSTTAFAASQPTFNKLLLPKEEGIELHINNRILAQVNGRPITVVDVMKKMDMIFYKQYPEYVGYKAARHQFYNMTWKTLLQDLIEKELMMADAEESKVAITSSEVRQELESMFGPDIIGNLDKIDMTLDEAMRIIQADLTIKRIIGFKVYSKAFRAVGPQEVRAGYEQYAAEHKTPEMWTYRVVTLRNKDSTAGAETAQRIYYALTVEKVPLENIKNESSIKLEGTTVTLSEEFSLQPSEISTQHKDGLQGLDEGEFSPPLAQFSRADKSTVFRIFFLKSKDPERAPLLKDVENQIKQILIGKSIDAEKEIYIEGLKKHYSVKERDLKLFPDDFEPFILEEKAKK